MNPHHSGDVTRTIPLFLWQLTINSKQSIAATYLAKRHCKEIDKLEEKMAICPECGSQRSYKDGMRYTRWEKFSVTCVVSVDIGFHNA